MPNRVLFVHDLVFKCDLRGLVYGGPGLDEKYFDRFFCSGFDSVSILSRASKIDELDPEYFKNKAISLSNACPKNYFGLLNPYFLFKVLKDLKKSAHVVISTPSVIGSFITILCILFRTPYSVEVAGDGDAFLSKKGGWLFASILGLMMPLFVKNAQGAAYVTNYLASKFPNKNKVLVASNVNIDVIYRRAAITKPLLNLNEVRIGFVGGLNKRKGVDVLIMSAQKLIVEKGYKNLTFHLVGGHNDFDLSAMLKEFNIGEQVIQHGLLPKKDVFNLMQSFDLYIQPSLSEGLPRATIEAMSFGLPVVATQLPGFQEILKNDVLVRPGDVEAIVAAIENFLVSVDFYNKQIDTNLKVAFGFLYETLHEKRCEYYRSFIKNEV